MLISAMTSGHYCNMLQPKTPVDEVVELEFQRQQTAATANAQVANSATSTPSAGGSTADTKPAQPTSKTNENFINQMLEQLVAKRIGLDKKKLDEIKAEIETLQQQRDALVEQADINPKVAQQLTQIDNKIAAMTKMMEELIAQDLERRTKQEQQQLQAESTKTTLVQKYQAQI